MITAIYLVACDGGCPARLELPMSDLRGRITPAGRRLVDEAVVDARDSGWLVEVDGLGRPSASYCPACRRPAELAGVRETGAAR